MQELTLSLPPAMYLFIEQEAAKAGISMDRYICALVLDTFEAV